MESLRKPIEEQNRIASLDMMRGFAILGIFMANMLSFHTPYLYIEPMEWWKDPFDKGIYMFIDVFIGASFYPLFSMLFGYGLVMLWEKAGKKGLIFYPIVLRRLGLLAIIGLIHAFFIWHGDILFTYALLGFIFLLFIKLSGKSMMITGSILYLLPNLFFLCLLIVVIILSSGKGFSIANPTLISQSLEIYQNGSFLDITEQRIKDWSYTNNFFGMMTQFFMLLPLFLIGGGVAKNKWLQRVGKNRKTFKIIFLIALLLGVLLKLIPYILPYHLVTIYIQDIFGGPLLAIAYGLLIVLLADTKGIRNRLGAMSYVGRMSFTNYLLQSIFATLIFYQYGWGLYGEVSVAFGTLLVFAIYIGQIIFSKLWLKHHYYGPVEWAWRNFSYWKKQKLRRKGELE